MYLVMGWCAVFAIKPLIDTFPPIFLLWIAVGGLCYTGGFLFYAFGKKVRYFHSVWHLFCLAGTVTHFVAILLYLIVV
jgi:hemolysin III